MPQSPQPVRRATAYDVVELTRLRGEMFLAMGQDIESDLGWRARCEQSLAEQLGTPRFAAFVVDAPDGAGLASCGVGWVDRRLPSPGRTELAGHLANMCTDPAHRRRGHARAVLDALMGWFVEQDVSRVELHATAEGRGLYEAVGFTEWAWPYLRWRSPAR